MPITTIPFSGFYNTAHDMQLDGALEQMCSDDSGELIESRHDTAYNAIDWRKVHLAYAQEYAANLASDCDATWTFNVLFSPREYNFRNDEIDVEIAPDELARMLGAIDHEAMTKLCEERLTECSGFIPFYDADWHTWGALDTWEAPQLGLLVECYCDAHCNGEQRNDLIDDCNGAITRMLESAIPSDTLALVYSD